MPASRCPDDILTSRRLIAADATGGYRFLLVKPTDLPTYVEYGVAVAGICGRDVLLEAEPDVHQPLDLGFGRCRLVLAGPAGDTAGKSQPTFHDTGGDEVPARQRRGSSARAGCPAEVIFLSGSVELAPNIGLAEMIVDLVETGTTLRENGLTIIEEIEESTARVIVNRAGFHIQHKEVQEFLNEARGGTSA